MAAPQSTLPDRLPMSWEQYCALDDSTPGEYIDGQLVMSPSPERQHQRACRRLANALEAVLPSGYEVDEAWHWSPAPGVNFIPDVMVYPTTTDTVRFTGTPVLAVEVLSQDRSRDLVVKSSRYAAAGLEHFWVVDREAGTLVAFRRSGTTYREVVTAAGEAVEIDFGIARITLRVPDLLT